MLRRDARDDARLDENPRELSVQGTPVPGERGEQLGHDDCVVYASQN